MAEAAVRLDSAEAACELVEPSYREVTETVARPLEWAPPRGWYIAFAVSSALLLLFVISVGWLLWEGVGVWGNKIPVAWGFPIVNFVFWVGIGHAGTLISAILFLFRQRWRTSINRAAEAMTLFAVLCALVFPAIHTGRPWLAYWMLPLPNQMGLWPQFRSPLMWDVFAVSIYGTVSLLFWYLGLIPDLATMRDRSRGVRRMLYGIFALGWRGSQSHWLHYEKSYLLLAGLATPLVLSVHSVVSLDFAVSILPGWHTTIFPPYFVAGAIFSGMAMVLTLMIICRTAFGLEQLITRMHLDRMAKIVLLTASMVAYSYAVEVFIAWFSGNPFERFALLNRALGPYAGAYWAMIACNVLVPQILWSRKARNSVPLLFVVSLLVNVGMWLERFVIVVTSLHRDFLPSSWSDFAPTIWDVTTLLGSFGLFFTLFCLFVRFLPMVAVSEVKAGLSEPDLVSEDPPPPEVVSTAAAANGYLAEFKDIAKFRNAVSKIRDAGYSNWDAHTPFPVHGLARRMGQGKSAVSWFVLIMGLAGAGAGMLLQWWTSTHAYPLVVSGKPLFSWPAFIPITFECGVLGGALGALLGFLILAKLPRHHHPVFHSSRFERCSDDRFFVSVEAGDPNFDPSGTRSLLLDLGACRVEGLGN